MSNEETPVIYRGTTPAITGTLDMDLTDYSCYLSIGQRAKKPLLTADNTQMELTVTESNGESVSEFVFTLTQEQTLALKPGTEYVQLRIIKDDDAKASNMAEINVLDIILDGEIEDEYDTN